MSEDTTEDVREREVRPTRQLSRRRPAGGADEGSRTAVLILGMHRSGTSALSRAMNLLGCDLPRTLMNPSRHNPAGYWESKVIANFNDRILDSAGSAWDDWLEFNPKWGISPKASEFREEARTLLREEFGESRFFVLKDPRICRFPKFWIECLADVGARSVALLPVRNPIEVARSLERRNGFDPAYGNLLWLRHLLEAERGSRGLPRVFVTYEQLLEQRSGLFDALDAALDFAWPRFSDGARAEIDAFLSERLRHHAQSSERVLKNRFLSPWLQQPFEIFARWAKHGEEAGDLPRLDAIRSELNAAAPAFARTVSAGRVAATRLHAQAADAERRAKRLAQLESRLDRVETERARRVEVIGQLRSRLEAAETERAERLQYVEELKGDLSDKTRKVAGLSHELVRLEGELKQLGCEKRTLVGQLVAAREALTETEKASESLAESYKAHLRQLLDEAQQLEETVNHLRQELEGANRALAMKEEAAARVGEEAAARVGEEATAKEIARVIGALLGTTRRLPLLGRVQRWRQAAMLRRARLFDPEWYLATYPDVASANLDPLDHYLKDGIREGRQPGPALREALNGNLAAEAPDAAGDTAGDAASR